MDYNEEIIMDILRANAYVDKGSEIPRDASLRDDLALDDLDTIELILALEEEFKIVIEDEEIGALNTVEDIFALIERKLNNE